MKKTASAIGVAIFGLSSSFLAAPAQAANIADCGTAPTGGTLTLSGDVCQLTFSTPGTYDFRTPNSIEGLSALLVGGGGGADWTADYYGQKAGYGGNGGKVAYVDLSASISGDSFSITVGSGGTSTTAQPSTDGLPSTITFGTSTTTAAGGVKGVFLNAPTYCQFAGNNRDYLGVGDGAGGNSTSRSGEPCAKGPGVNPSLGTADSTGAAASTLFAGINQEFGMGGNLIALPMSMPTQVAGAGASVAVDGAGAGAAPVAEAAGANGLVTFVWRVVAPVDSNETDKTDELASTGADQNIPLFFGAAALALGSMLLMRATRRPAK